ncbi:CinA family protein [Pseudohoeflea suaedae]|uniref:CinA family protein n=1 Tax=Pseudohoeflea suaedae TaxID=877384 RepID=A0A4R5PKH5_9HYPH|nr:CinA family protein [Pseudohoeflea suaedae]TDH36217.1 CinA family protein [Pseudohoeflea suaedae]
MTHEKDAAAILDDCRELAAQIVARFATAGTMIATAESCTGGLIAGMITEIAGSSAVFDRGFVTYSNAAKVDMLGVRPQTLDTHGAVSPVTAVEMAAGALALSNAQYAVSVTGIAGPGGGTAAKPVGLVYMGLAARDGDAEAAELRWNEDWPRDLIRAATVHATLEALIERFEEDNA